MLCIPIIGPTFQEAQKQISSASAHADVLEFRLDLMKDATFEQISEMKHQLKIPCLFTLRPQSQGGLYEKSEAERLKLIGKYSSLGPDYFDLEYTLPPETFLTIKQRYPATKTICSFHHFENTPDDLNGILSILKKLPADFYKIATMTRSGLDALRLLQFQKQEGQLLSVMGMGPHGYLTRILGKICGCPFTYASLDAATSSAPGQLDADTLLKTYHFKALDASTTLFALLGHPVDKSRGHVIHNAILEAFHYNGVYVKIDLTPDELPLAWRYMKDLPFKGFSVTMPLKENILKLADECSEDVAKIGAANTLLIKNKKILAYNTDSVGALQAIQEKTPVKGKQIIILGAGGAAKAIAYEALNLGAKVLVLNRTVEKAQEMARSLGCQADNLDKMDAYAKTGYDILINCTPIQMPISSEFLNKGAVVMDIITNPKDTQFLIEARRRGCQIVYGYKMWVYQALKQLEIWLGSRADLALAKEIAEDIYRT